MSPLSSLPVTAARIAAALAAPTAAPTMSLLAGISSGTLVILSREGPPTIFPFSVETPTDDFADAAVADEFQ